MIADASNDLSTRLGPAVSGSFPDGTVVCINSARCHRARPRDKSGLHSLSGELPGTAGRLSRDTGVVMNAAFVHQSVMLAEITDVFAGMNDGVFLDATLGGAGHSVALLRAHSDLRLLGIDQDDVALAAASEVLSQADCGGRATLRRARFDSLATVVVE